MASRTLICKVSMPTCMMTDSRKLPWPLQTRRTTSILGTCPSSHQSTYKFQLEAEDIEVREALEAAPVGWAAWQKMTPWKAWNIHQPSSAVRNFCTVRTQPSCIASRWQLIKSLYSAVVSYGAVVSQLLPDETSMQLEGRRATQWLRTTFTLPFRIVLDNVAMAWTSSVPAKILRSN